MKRNLTLFFIAAICFFACKKPKTDIERQSAVNLRTLANVSAPTVQNGILTFADDEHYDVWLEYLDQALIRDSTSEDTTTTAEILTQIEQSLSFNSLRKKLDTEFEAMNVIGWNSLDEIPVMHFIGDKVILSTLNEYGEVRIGNEVITRANKEYSIVTTDESLLPAIRNFLASGSTNLMEVYTLNGVIPDDNLTLRLVGLDVGTTEMQKITGEDYRATFGHIVVSSKPCEPLEVQISDIAVFDYANPPYSMVLTNYVIDWKDGTVDYVQDRTIIARHVYAMPGLKTVEVRAYPVGASQTVPTHTWKKQINAKAPSICSNTPKHTGYVWKATPDLKRCTRDYLLLSFSSKHRRFTASTESYEWKNNKWRTVKADKLKAEVCARITDYNTCQFISDVCDVCAHSKDKYVQASFKMAVNQAWDFFYSNHDLYYGSQWFNHHQGFTTCP